MSDSNPAMDFCCISLYPHFLSTVYYQIKEQQKRDDVLNTTLTHHHFTSWYGEVVSKQLLIYTSSSREHYHSSGVMFLSTWQKSNIHSFSSVFGLYQLLWLSATVSFCQLVLSRKCAVGFQSFCDKNGCLLRIKMTL